MNMQALMRQAQSLQKDMLKSKEEIDKMEFTATSNLVSVKVNGKKEVLNVKIEAPTDFSGDDIDMLEDMIMVAVNEAFKQVDKETEKKMGKYTSMMPGLF
ncbi:MAG: YbaB/EbfC family nucleoid-associated protein [Erysipelotrichaceae bacterium]|nr:YbaB/EbfC family nucleoid-associated protein [Erysipelotrichaceae bacterium]